MKRIKKQYYAAAATLLVIIIGFSSVIYTRIYVPAVTTDRYIYIPSGATYATLLDSLGESGDIIGNTNKFRNSALLVGLNKKVHPGRYQLKNGMSYIELARMFKHGLQKPIRLTFNNIRTLDRLAGAVARQLETDSVTTYKVFSNDTICTKYGFTPQTFIAMFIPNTYEFYWNTTPEKFIEKMNKEYIKFWSKERLDKLGHTHLTKTEATTLASIVYEETKMSDEMPTVAGVYINRINVGMPLQADPTVKFALGDFAIRRVLNKHLEVDSPYNTYKYSGLPPGPICMPSVKALDAVLNYKEHNYLYFCAKSDFSGYHSFATNLSEHNRNAAAYATALNKKKIFR